jgi:hypothetical protein
MSFLKIVPGAICADLNIARGITWMIDAINAGLFYCVFRKQKQLCIIGSREDTILSDGVYRRPLGNNIKLNRTPVSNAAIR